MNYHQMGLRDNQRFQMGATLKATGLVKEEVQKNHQRNGQPRV
ncbi:hypothetical protein [Candidatus Villigracilis vicinus]